MLDEQDRLHGVVPTRRLLLGSPEQTVAEIMVSPVITISSQATVLEACEFFTIHRLLAFPVVNAQRMVGVVDVDLYTQGLDNVEQSERSGELFQLIGVHLAASQQASPVASFKARFPWLLCNLAGGIVAAFLAGLFEAELARVVSLALFIPVVLALAESVSIQSVSLALQMLHGGSPSLRSLAAGIPRESITGDCWAWQPAQLWQAWHWYGCSRDAWRCALGWPSAVACYWPPWSAWPCRTCCEY